MNRRRNERIMVACKACGNYVRFVEVNGVGWCRKCQGKRWEGMGKEEEETTQGRG